MDHLNYLDMFKFLAPVISRLEYIQLPQFNIDLSAIISYKSRKCRGV